MMRQHLAIDRRREGIYWVRSRAGKQGLRPIESGCFRLRPERDPELEMQAFLDGAVVRGTRLEIGLRSPELVHQRELMPVITAAEAGAVARRHCSELVQGIDGEACHGFVLSPGGENSGVLWLSGAPLDAARAAAARFERSGFELHRLSSRHLALGNLVQLLPPVVEDELIAIVDLEPDAATCVVADGRGWAFSREIPLVPMTEDLGFSSLSAFEETTWALGELEAREFDVEKEAEEPDADPLEIVAELTELLSTELARTFQYVAGGLRLASAGRVYLAGEGRWIESLVDSLTESLSLPVETLSGALTDRTFENCGGGGAVALGLALAPHAHGGNLLPPRELVERARRRVRSRLRLGLAASALTAVLLAVVLIVTSQGLQTQISELGSRWEAERAERESLAELRRQQSRAAEVAALLTQLDPAVPPWTALLETFGRLAPENAWIETFHASRSPATEEWTTELAIEAVGDSVSEAARSVSELARGMDVSPLMAVDDLSREDVGQADDESARDNRVRFRVTGRLAVVEPTLSTPVLGGADD